MISNKKDLYKLINSILKPSGFTQKGDTWYLHTDECICFLNIGKSPYGGYYGDVIGCFLKEINQDKGEFPSYYKCNLKYYLENLTGERDLVNRVLDLENKSFTKNEREIVLKDLIENYALPFLEEIGTRQGIKNASKKYKGLTKRMNVDIKKALSIED